MNAVTERVVEMLQAREWKFEVDEECQMVSTGFTGHNAQWRVTAGGFNDFTVLILSHFPVDCPQPKRRVCAELRLHNRTRYRPWLLWDPCPAIGC